MSENQIITEQIKILPEDLQKKVMENKTTVEEFINWVKKEFKETLIGVSIIPKEFSILENEEDKKSDKIHLFTLLDDSKTEDIAKLKLEAIKKCIEFSQQKEIKPEIMLLSELWQNCFDSNFEVLKIFSLGYNVYDRGLFCAIKVSEVHKILVLEKFEKYVVAYVLAGSTVRGEATPTSDVDVFVVIDDTDVKRMTRVELREKLRAIILESGFIAKEKTGVKNDLNIQVYLLTEFWDSLRQANPVIYTFLRDGIPLYDRGIFMPWKQLLKMGMIQPSPEAVERLFETGERIIEDVKNKVKELIIEDLYYAVLTPSQAALMKYGIAIPPPKGTPTLFRSIFIEKENMIEEKYAKILEDAIKVRKEIEHGTVKELKPEDLAKYYKNAEDFIKRIKKLFNEIEERKEREIIVKIYDDVITIIRDTLKTEGIEKIDEKEIRDLFNEHLIKSGKIPQKFLRMLDQILESYEKYTKNESEKIDMNKLRQNATEFMKGLIEYLQAQNFRKLETYKIRFKGKNKVYELIPTEKANYLHEYETNLIHVLDKEMNFIETIEIDKLNEILTKEQLKRLTLKREHLEKLEKHFNEHFEIFL
ncbi:MAG: nucleotidyltransferase domain-containing protein [Candidatus Woesearchaeota archaeon]